MYRILLLAAIFSGLLIPSCADGTAKPGTRAYAIHKGLRGEQIDEHVRNFNARGFQNKDGQIELEPRKATPSQYDPEHWKVVHPEKKGSPYVEYDTPGFLDDLFSGKE